MAAHDTKCVILCTPKVFDVIFHQCDSAYSYVWHDSFRCVTWLVVDVIHSRVWVGSYRGVTLRICTCCMAHLRGWHDSCAGIYESCYTCELYVWHDSFIRLHSYVSHNSFEFLTWLVYVTHESFIWLICLCEDSISDSVICVIYLHNS